MKKRLLLFLFTSVFCIGFSQDTIVKYNSEIIYGKVLKPITDNIKYTAIDSAQALFSIKTRSIKKIYFSDNHSEIFLPNVLLLYPVEEYKASKFKSIGIENNLIFARKLRYFSEGKQYTARKIGFNLWTSKNPKILECLEKSEKANKIGRVGWFAIPFCAASAIITFSSYGLYGPKTNVVDEPYQFAGLICCALGHACPLISLGLNRRQTKYFEKAIYFHNLEILEKERP